MDLFANLLNELESWGADPRLALDETFLGNDVFYRECLTKFAHDDNRQILRASLLPEKKEAAIRAAHTLKGNADYLGLFPIMDAAMTVLTLLRADQLEQAKAHLPELDDAFACFSFILKMWSD